MSKIEQTRDRLKLDNLNKKDRKELFEKFVERGGEIVKDKNNTPTRIEKQTTVRKNTQNGSDENSQNYSKNQTKDNTKNEEKIKSEKIKPYISRSYSFTLWFNAVINGVISISGKSINYNFLRFIEKTAITAMIEMENITFNALNPPANTRSEAMEKRQKIISLFKDPDDTELLERVKYLYDENKYKNILRPMYDLSTKINPENAIEDIKAIIKPIYVLHLYSTRLKMKAEHALNSYALLDKISKSIISSRIASFKKDTDIIFEKYYPKLLILMKYAAKRKLETSSDLNDFLDISEVDVLGYYTIERQRAQKNKEEQIDNIKDNIGTEKKEEQKQNKIVAIGLKLIDKLISFKKEDNGIFNDSVHFYAVEEEDKVYRTKILLDMLDREYSPLFISSKVKYNVIYDHNQKTDYQAEFNNSFLALGDTQVRLIEYSDLVKNIQKIESDSLPHFEKRTAMLSEKNIQRSYLAKNLKMTFISILTPLKKNLDKLLLDKAEREKFIENPNDILTFDKTFGREKNHLQGYTVMKALTEAYYYISALHYLSTEGELSGAGVLIDSFDTKNTLNAKKIESENLSIESSELEIEDNEDTEVSQIDTDDTDNMSIERLEDEAQKADKSNKKK